MSPPSLLKNSCYVLSLNSPHVCSHNRCEKLLEISRVIYCHRWLLNSHVMSPLTAWSHTYVTIVTTEELLACVVAELASCLVTWSQRKLLEISHGMCCHRLLLNSHVCSHCRSLLFERHNHCPFRICALLPSTDAMKRFNICTQQTGCCNHFLSNKSFLHKICYRNHFSFLMILASLLSLLSACPLSLPAS